MNSQLVVRLSNDQLDTIRGFAHAARTTPSGLVSTLVKAILQRRYAQLSVKDGQGLEQILASVAKTLGMPEDASPGDILQTLQDVCATLDAPPPNASQESADMKPATLGACGSRCGSRGCSGDCGGNHCTALANDQIRPEPKPAGFEKLSDGQKRNYRALRASRTGHNRKA